MIIPLPLFYDPDAQIVRCTVATQEGITGGWLLGLDFRGEQAQYVVRLDNSSREQWFMPEQVNIHGPSPKS